MFHLFSASKELHKEFLPIASPRVKKKEKGSQSVASRIITVVWWEARVFEDVTDSGLKVILEVPTNYVSLGV